MQRDRSILSTVPRNGRLAKRLAVFMELNQEEIDYLDQLQQKEIRLNAGTDIISEGNPYQFSYILKDGWAINYKLLPEGSRQIINFLLPGDFIGLRANWFKTAEASVAGLTDIIVSPMLPHRIITGSQKFPKLGAAIAWSSARDESIMIEHIVSLGRRKAYERIAHLILELRKRLQIVGFTRQRSFILPVTQEVLGDYLGLTVVHVNRTLKKLRERGLIAMEGERLIIKDIEGLERTAGFDGDYLKQDKPSPMTTAFIERIDPSAPVEAPLKKRLGKIQEAAPAGLKSTN
ncbi:MAG: Crp/Fnr family transcriptional regulator [Rhodospirillales bacterium]